MRFTKLIIALSVMSFSLVGCGDNGTVGTGAGGGVPALTLALDQASPVPVVNGNPTQFYVYIKNTSSVNASDLSWTIKQQESAQVSGIFSQAKAWLSSHIGNTSKVSLNESSSPITIIDASACSTIAANNSCKVLLQANSASGAELQGVNTSGQLVVSSSVVSSYNYTTTNSGNPADSLILSPISQVALVNGYASSSLSIINNGSGAIDVTNVLGTLPSGVTWSFASCANPLPVGGICQLRLVYTANPGQTSATPVTIAPQGEVIASDGTKTPLPTQNSSGTIEATSVKIAQLNAAYSGLSLSGNFPETNNSAVGYISNTGSAAASIKTLSIANSAFSLTDDKCSNTSLNPGETCSYIISANVAQLSILTNGNYTSLISIPYNNSQADTSSSAMLNYSYNYIIPASLGISLNSISDLTQLNRTSSVNIINNSNVALTNLSAPVLSGATENVVLSDPNNCTGSTLSPSGTSNSSCSYTLTFNPKVPSQHNLVTIGGISANYTDPVTGITQATSFTNNTSTNLNSVFEGLLSVSGASLTDTSFSATLTVINTGNYKANLSSIQLSGNNVQINGGTCSSVTVLNESTVAGSSCTINVALTSTAVAASGAANVQVIYDNNNGNATASASNNVSWVVGDAPSLQVSFAPNNNLTTTINGQSTRVITLTNNGKNTLTNIQLPSLNNATLSYANGSSNSCNLSGQQLSGQNLNHNEACSLTLQYKPTQAAVQSTVVLGRFGATYNGSQVYTTDNYDINLTALAAATLTLTPNSLTPSLDWTNNTSYQSIVKVTNTGGSTNITNPQYITHSGCNLGGAGLAVNDSCDMVISGNYPTQSTSYNTGATLGLSYTDAGGTYPSSLSINATVAMQPVVTGGVSITGTLPSTMLQGATSQITLTLTNTTTATNSGDKSIKLNMDSLTSSIGANLSGSLNTTGISSNPCSSASGYITLAANQSCSVNLVLSNSATGNFSTSTATLTPSYQSNVYSSTSTSPTWSADTPSASSLSGVITIYPPQAALSLSYLNNITSLSAEQNLPAPTGTLQVQNVGTAALTSFSMPTVSGFTFTPDAGCTTLAAGASCNVGMSLSTTAAIARANLNTKTVTAGNGNPTPTTIALPFLTYSVTAPNAPNIVTTQIVDKCGAGSTTALCNLNPTAGGGSAGMASAYRFRVTYSNNGSGVANNFSIAESLAAVNTAYTLDSGASNCLRITTLAIGTSCTMEYQLTNPNVVADVADIAANVADIAANTTLASYSYTYGSQNQISIAGIAKQASALDVNLVQPTISLVLPTNPMATSTSQTATATLSNWYVGPPPPSLSFNSASTSIATIGAVSMGLSPYTAGINATATVGSSVITASKVAPNGETITSPSITLTTELPRLVIFVSATPTTGNIKGTAANGIVAADAICNADESRPVKTGSVTYKAMIVDGSVRAAKPTPINWVLQANRDYYQVNGTTKIGTTNESQVFTFNLLASIGTSTGVSVWTGFLFNWTTKATRCTNWGSDSDTGGFGNTNSLSSNSIAFNNSTSCSNDFRLYCVQQPSQANP